MDNDNNLQNQAPASPPEQSLGSEPAANPAGPSMVTPPSTGKPKPIALIVAVLVGLLLIGGAVYALTSKDSDKKGDDKTENTSQSSGNDSGSRSSNNAVTAKRSSEFSAVCTNGSILNAADYSAGAKPHKVVAFYKRGDRNSFSSQSVGYGEDYYVSSDTDISEIAVVACLEEIEGSSEKALTCDYEKDGETINVDLYSSRYSLSFHSAKTGDKLADGADVNAPATRCPMFLAYDQSTMTAQASIDENSLDAEIQKFAL